MLLVRRTPRIVKTALLRLLPGIAVSVGFLAWFLYSAHWEELGDALLGARPGLVVLSAAVLFTEFFIRALRWKVLLRPIAPAARLGRLFVATVIGMSLNVVLPFRAGDLARPWLGARETGTPVLPLVTVAVIERVFDIIGLFSIFCLMLVLLPEDAAAQGPLVQNLKDYGSLLGVFGGLGLCAFLLMAFSRAQSRRVFMTLAPLLGPLRARVVQLYDGLSEGLESVRSPRALAEALALSWLHWFNGSLSILVLFHAFSLDLPPAAACFTSVAIALGAAAPQAPGFVGVFHVIIENTLTLWGQPVSPSKAFAIVFWGVSFLPITLVGALLWWRQGLSLAEIRGSAAPAGTDAP